MRRTIFVLLILGLSACTAEPLTEPRDVGTTPDVDAGPQDAGEPSDAGPLDAAPLDAAPLDAGAVLTCWPCDTTRCAPELCTDRPALTPGSSRTMQDTAAGGHGDCALSGSGTGGNNLYYAVQIDGAHLAVFRLTPRSAVEHGGAMMRLFSDCAASDILALNRLERDDGRLTLCAHLEDPTAPARDLVLAVSNYHQTDFAFDLSMTLTDSSTVCEPYETMRIP